MFSGLWRTVMCQCSFLNFNECTNLEQNAVDNGEALGVWGEGLFGNSGLLSQFYCEPKTAPKNKSLFF